MQQAEHMSESRSDLSMNKHINKHVNLTDFVVAASSSPTAIQVTLYLFEPTVRSGQNQHQHGDFVSTMNIIIMSKSFYHTKPHRDNAKKL